MSMESLTLTRLADEQYAWFGGILGALTLFAIVGAWITVSRTWWFWVPFACVTDEVEHPCVVVYNSCVSLSGIDRCRNIDVTLYRYLYAPSRGAIGVKSIT
jgi:hypothetical protein